MKKRKKNPQGKKREIALNENEKEKKNCQQSVWNRIHHLLFGSLGHASSSADFLVSVDSNAFEMVANISFHYPLHIPVTSSIGT